jgi:hypothetical protein
MTRSLPLLLAVMNATAFLLGSVITRLAYRAYRRTQEPALRAFTTGIGLLTIGVMIGGVLHQMSWPRLFVGTFIQSMFSVGGFALLVYSAYTKRASVLRLVAQ